MKSEPRIYTRKYSSHICGPGFGQEYKENLAAAEASKAGM